MHGEVLRFKSQPWRPALTFDTAKKLTAVVRVVGSVQMLPHCNVCLPLEKTRELEKSGHGVIVSRACVLSAFKRAQSLRYKNWCSVGQGAISSWQAEQLSNCPVIRQPKLELQ